MYIVEESLNCETGLSTPMMRVYDVATAVATILRRPAWDELAIPDPLLDRLEATFGERVTPDEAVRRILADVRTRGDAAVLDWSAKVDGVRPPCHGAVAG
jgi:histidinol dehydrogenase